MAMNGTTLGNEIAAALATLSDSDKGDLSKCWGKIATAIVTHIQTNAVISTNVAVTSVSGVTVGAGVSGPGAGTGTGTIS